MAQKPKKKLNKKKSKEEPPPKRRSWISAAPAAVMTLLVLALVAYIGLRMIATTEGFCYFLGEKLTERWGCPVTIESSRMNRWLDLKLGGVQGGSKMDVESAGHFVFRTVRLELDHSAGLLRGRRNWVRSIDVDGGDVEFRPDPGGTGQPLWLYTHWKAFLAFSGIRDSAEKGGDPVQNLSAYPAVQWAALPRLHVTGLSVTDRVSESPDVLLLDQVDLAVVPLRLPAREVHYMRVTSAAGGYQRSAFRNMQLEWISRDGLPAVLDNRVDWVSTRQPAADVRRGRAPSAPAIPEGRETVRYYLEQQPPPAPKTPTRNEVEKTLKEAFQ